MFVPRFKQIVEALLWRYFRVVCDVWKDILMNVAFADTYTLVCKYKKMCAQRQDTGIICASQHSLCLLHFFSISCHWFDGFHFVKNAKCGVVFIISANKQRKERQFDGWDEQAHTPTSLLQRLYWTKNGISHVATLVMIGTYYIHTYILHTYIHTYYIHTHILHRNIYITYADSARLSKLEIQRTTDHN